MPSFTFIDTAGKQQNVDAADATTAMKMAAGIAPNSGVISNPPGIGGAAAPTTPAGTTPASTDPVIGSSPVRRYSTTSAGVGANSTSGKANAYYDALQTGPVDENKIRSTMRQQAQAQLDAINQSYDSIVAKDNATGVDSLGKTRATQARSGNLGSDFGNGALDTTQRNNDQVVAADNAARASAIAGILANVDTRADAKIQAEKTLAQTNGAAYIKHLEDTANSSRADVINLSKSGVGFDQLTQEQYTKLLDQTGYTPEQLKAQFILNQPDPIYKGISGSKYIVSTRNPTTGKVDTQSFDLGFTPPQDYDSQTLDTGQVIFTPKNWDGDPKKIITYGTPSAKYYAETNAANASAANSYANAAKTRKETASGGTDATYTIPKANRNELLKYGFGGTQIDNLQNDIRTYGLGKALEGLDSNTQELIRTQLDPKYVVSQ